MSLNAPSNAACCLYCGASPTIRAHLIPKSFAKEVRGDDKNFALINQDLRISQSGLFDDSLLCGECDGRLGKNEKYALETFRRLRSATTSKLNTHVGVSPVSGDRLIRFAAGLAWKYSVARPEYGRISIGPYSDVLKCVAFGDNEDHIPLTIDMVMVRLKALRFEERFFRAPKPDRQFGVNFVRMTLGAFLMLLKIDRRPAPVLSSPEIWMRGRTEVVFPVLPLRMFEEGHFATEGWKRDEKLAKFLFGPVLSEIKQ